ncbi:glycosyltransferase [Luteibacter yeojuensis]|uniref:Glycosyl transferase n=1 Tax=Luteibacter yeojuensis TaxID=345309 RepID=A0A0F3KZV2_9GAMM|nr:glycosyltransferase [Luteibacter yeojuensis]KJV36815.1 glycosyl transferase [Luteibacter yeojuensis]
MSSLPLVSILIPAYNHEAFVERCLDSVLEDPYPAKEVVIIDDGSTDKTSERIQAWIDRHGHEVAIEFTHRANKGIAATLNELAARARGEFFRLGASDDYLLPGGLEAQVRYLASHPRKGAVIGDSVVVDRDGRRLHGSGMADLHHADKRLYATDQGIRRAVITRWAVGGPVALLRRSALETVARWTEGLRIDDWDLFLRLAASDALGFIDVPVCAYRLHGSNLSKTRHRATRIVNLEESREVAIRRMPLFDEPCRTLLRAQVHYIGAKIAFLQGRPGTVACRMACFALLRAFAALRPAAPHPHPEQA